MIHTPITHINGQMQRSLQHHLFTNGRIIAPPGDHRRERPGWRRPHPPFGRLESRVFSLARTWDADPQALRLPQGGNREQTGAPHPQVVSQIVEASRLPCLRVVHPFFFPVDTRPAQAHNRGYRSQRFLAYQPDADGTGLAALAR